MIKLLLVAAVIALGADALLHNGAYTQAAWRELSAQIEKLDATVRGTTEDVAKRDGRP